MPATKLRLATVVRTWGSSPRPIGSQLAINADGRFAGSVSGGCIEGRGHYRGPGDDGRRQTKRKLEFGVSDAMAWEVGLACGGEIEVFVEKLDA